MERNKSTRSGSSGNQEKLKTKTVTDTVVEVTYAVSLEKDEAKLVSELKAISGVEKAVLVSYNGEYME